MNSSRYRHPVPSRTEIVKAMERAGRPLKLDSIARRLRLKGARREAALRRRLKAMVREGRLTRNRAGEYRLAQRQDRFDDPGEQTQSAILSHGIPHEFSPRVVAEAAKMPSSITVDARRGRKDLRELPLVTIDGADAKDFDDAVYCEPRGNGWRLIVVIADVGHYVRAGTGLDKEARERGTSVYFPDRVVPMLPEALSNGLCSLQPQQDRLCLCCEMIVSRQGEVKQSRFYEAVMRSARRFTYDEAARLLSGRPGSSGRPALSGRPGQSGADDTPVADSATFRSLKALADVHAAFLARRRERGALEFNLNEVALELDDRGRISGVAPRQRLVTHRIIEECMIAANVEAAKWLRKARIPTLYRVHHGPTPERVDELILFLRSLGITSVAPGRLQPADMNRVLKATASGPEAELVETMLLRSMARAEYRPKNRGHFGLALPAYAHFTSPIRRYPDLLVHRAIKHLLRRGKVKGFGYDMVAMERLGRHCSQAEKRADEAVWDVEERLKCAWLKDRVGDEFTVSVAGIAPFGLFVRVPELAIDGLVHVTALPRDYYHVVAGGSALTGENSGVTYRLTDRLEVRLASVSVRERKIDLVPVD